MHGAYVDVTTVRAIFTINFTLAMARILSIGHSYVVALNRRLINEIARLGDKDWQVTAVAPTFLHGDLRPLHLQVDSQDVCQIEAVPTYFSQQPHIMTYSWQLRQILQHEWDLVHCWEEPYILAGGQIAWWTPRNIPVVFFTFQNYVKSYPPPFNWIEHYAMKRAAAWICCGHTVAEALRPRRGYALPMRLIPYGVDLQHFCPSPEARATIRRVLNWQEQGAPVVGYLGRFVPEKGLDLLMRVLDQLQTPWRALFIGTGVMEAALQNWANRHPEKVRICTNVKHHEVPQYLNAMDLLCAPSQTTPHWREQFGRMLIEAFACGVPVIGSDSGEIPYVIQDAGIVVGEKDEAGWFKSISDLLESDDRRQTLAAQGLDRAHSTYAWSIIARQHLDFFSELL
jgi:glycosyltransferase involved in cell wall biosynthesis